MYIQKDTIYSDPYKYLVNEDKNMIAYSAPANEKGWIEVEMETPIRFKKVDNLYTWENDHLAVFVEKLDYNAIKTLFVKQRYTNDDQIAIMINKDSDDPEDVDTYKRMQAWRDYAAHMSKELIQQNNE